MHDFQSNTRSNKLQGKLTRKRVSSLIPARENGQLYRDATTFDPDIRELANSIRQFGVREAFVVTQDNIIISGHRRRLACLAAGVQWVPCRVLPFRRHDRPEYFLRLLREYNRQRDKSAKEQIREGLLDASDSAKEYRWRVRVEERRTLDGVEIVGSTRRCEITAAKRPMLEAAKRVIEERNDFWPLSLRAIHYALLSDPPLRNADDPESTYANTPHSYRDLSDLLVRARLVGEVGWDCMCDETRPTTTWRTWPNPREFVQQQTQHYLTGYVRDIQQSQPHHVEIVCEKNSVYPILRAIAARYGVPITSGRGFASISAWNDLVERYSRSGKTRLVVIVSSDFDPEGEEIVQVAGRTLRDDFAVRDVVIVKAALTAEQVRKNKLPRSIDAKPSSSRYRRFVQRYGTHAYELEALGPEQLQDAVSDALGAAMDRERWNAEVQRHNEDLREIAELRTKVLEAVRKVC